MKDKTLNVRGDQPHSLSRLPMLREVVRQRARLRHLSYHTEKQYVNWTRRFVRFHGMRHPKTMGEQEIEAFLSHLAVKKGVSPSTQNQALKFFEILGRFCKTVQGDNVRYRQHEVPPCHLR